MKHILILISVLFLAVTSCTNRELSDKEGFGYLSVEGIRLSCHGDILPLTRVVDAGLQLQIYKGEEVIKEYAPGTDLSKRVTLPVGVYTLKAFTPNQEEAESTEKGIPVYSISHDFTISDGDLTAISLVAPQINVGVSVAFSDAFKTDFHDMSVTVSSVSGRSITINGADDTDYYYFNIPSDYKLKYVVSAMNQDNEPMTLTKEISSVEAKRYQIIIDID